MIIKSQLLKFLFADTRPSGDPPPIGFDRRSFTLVETLIGVSILSVGVLIALMFFVRANLSTQLAQDMTVATTHGDFLLEEMYAQSSLGDIVDRDWRQWAAQAGLNTLPEEEIAIVFGDPQQVPLVITVTVSWQRKGRPHKISLTTELIK